MLGGLGRHILNYGPCCPCSIETLNTRKFHFFYVGYLQENILAAILDPVAK